MICGFFRGFERVPRSEPGIRVAGRRTSRICRRFRPEAIGLPIDDASTRPPVIGGLMDRPKPERPIAMRLPLLASPVSRKIVPGVARQGPGAAVVRDALRSVQAMKLQCHCLDPNCDGQSTSCDVGHGCSCVNLHEAGYQCLCN